MTDILRLNKAYFTKIECSNYNPNIDGEVTVTVSLIDFNGSPIPNTVATITVDRGYFTNYKRNNSNTQISGTSTKSYEGTTGDDGTFVMTYKCSEWGLATFSTNNLNIQVLIKRSDWHQVSTFNNGNLIVNDELGLAFFKLGITSYNFSQANSYYTIGTLPEGYRPLVATPMSLTSTTEWAVIETDGKVKIARNTTGSSSVAAVCMYNIR